MKNTIKIYDAKRIATKSDGTKMPVVDSKFTFLITPNEADIKNGVPGDHANCMYCLACRRMHGSELVWVTRSIAYVELKDKNGKPQLHRFLLSDPAKVKIKDFDAARHVPPHSVVFAAPTGQHTLEARAKLQILWRRKQRNKPMPSKKAYVTGTKRDHTIHALEATALRNPATGLFQFKVNPRWATA